MLISQIFFRDDAVVLRDVDGSEESLPFDDAIELHVWLSAHLHEIERRKADAYQRLATEAQRLALGSYEEIETEIQELREQEEEDMP